MIYPDSFEHKIGFDAVRTRLTELCGSSLGAANVQAMRFSSDFSMIDLELRRTAEMLAIAEGSDPLPLRNMHDVTTTLKRCRIEGASVSLDELLKIRQSLQTISDLHAFFTPKVTTAPLCPTRCWPNYVPT